jgi:hypothetical protein
VPRHPQQVAIGVRCRQAELPGVETESAYELLADPCRVGCRQYGRGAITVSIGGLDISTAINDCSGDVVCVSRSGVFQTVRTNMTVIYDQLRAAAPDADIIYLVPHNFTITDFPCGNPSWAALDVEMRALAAAHRVKVADAFAAITLAGRTCELTFLCLPPDQSDIHPNDAGYAVMAHLIFQPPTTTAADHLIWGVAAVATLQPAAHRLGRDESTYSVMYQPRLATARCLVCVTPRRTMASDAAAAAHPRPLWTGTNDRKQIVGGRRTRSTGSDRPSGSITSSTAVGVPLSREGQTSWSVSDGLEGRRTGTTCVS